MLLAHSMSGTAWPVVPSGKKSSGSQSRQAALLCQSGFVQVVNRAIGPPARLARLLELPTPIADHVRWRAVKGLGVLPRLSFRGLHASLLMAFPCPRSRLMGEGGMELPAVELALGALEILAELDQAESETAAAAPQGLERGRAQLLVLPALMFVSEALGEAGHLAPVQGRDLAAHGHRALLPHLGQLELAHPSQGPHERRVP